MKLYMFQCGIIKTQKHLITMGRGIGQPFDIPVPFSWLHIPRATCFLIPATPLRWRTTKSNTGAPMLWQVTIRSWIKMIMMYLEMANSGLCLLRGTPLVTSHYWLIWKNGEQHCWQVTACIRRKFWKKMFFPVWFIARQMMFSLSEELVIYNNSKGCESLLGMIRPPGLNSNWLRHITNNSGEYLKGYCF